MTDDDERSEWARKILKASDVEEIMFKTDRFIAFEAPAVTMSIQLSINEAIRMCRLWDYAVDGDTESKRHFLEAIGGAIEYIDDCLEQLGIDYLEELIDDWDSDEEEN